MIFHGITPVAGKQRYKNLLSHLMAGDVDLEEMEPFHKCLLGHFHFVECDLDGGGERELEHTFYLRPSVLHSHFHGNVLHRVLTDQIVQA